MKAQQSVTTASTSSPSALDTPYYVKACAHGIPAYLVGVHLWTWVFTLSIFLSGRADFRQLYAAGYMVRTGHANELYDYHAQKYFQDKLVSPEQQGLPFVSPAYHALFFAPLSFLSYRAAYFAFLAFNVAALGICFALLRPWMHNLRAVYWWLPLAVFLGFLPLAAAFIQGQDSILLTALLAGAFVFLSKRLDSAAGILTGLGLFKFPITIPIALLFLIWRRWRFFLGFGVSALVLASVSVWLAGAAQTKLYVESLLSIAGLRPATSGLTLYPVSWQMMANVHGFIFGMGGGWIPKLWLHTATLLLTGVVLVWTAVRGSRINNAPNLLLLAIPCSVLVAHHTYIHDLSVLLLPTVVLLNFFLSYEGQGKKMERWINRSAAFMFVAPVAESFFPEHFYSVTIAVGILLLGVSAAITRPAFVSWDNAWTDMKPSA